MCFHLSVNKRIDYLEKRFQAKFVEKFEPLIYANGFDLPRLPVITQKDPDKIQLFNWGLIPSWVKDKDSANKIRSKTLNARADTIFQKPSFRQPIKKNRCLVLADGFYDWRTFKGKKYPYYIKLKNNQAFGFAGIWEVWQNDYTFSIITTEANSLISQIHNIKKRMPVILAQNEEKDWLDPKLEKDDIEVLLNPYEAEKMEAYTISKLITSRGQNRNVSEVIDKFKYNELPEII